MAARTFRRFLPVAYVFRLVQAPLTKHNTRFLERMPRLWMHRILLDECLRRVLPVSPAGLLRTFLPPIAVEKKTVTPHMTVLSAQRPCSARIHVATSSV